MSVSEPVAPLWLAFNINAIVRVKFTEDGDKALRDNGYEAKPDAEGWSTWRLWELMHAVGDHLYCGGPTLFENNVIEIGDT